MRFWRIVYSRCIKPWTCVYCDWMRVGDNERVWPAYLWRTDVCDGAGQCLHARSFITSRRSLRPDNLLRWVNMSANKAENFSRVSQSSLSFEGGWRRRLTSTSTRRLCFRDQRLHMHDCDQIPIIIECIQTLK